MWAIDFFEQTMNNTNHFEADSFQGRDMLLIVKREDEVKLRN